VLVLVLVAILWIAVLVPGVISKLHERRSAGSIGRFHQRLDLLERTGPKLVKPAYRLTGSRTASIASPVVVPVAPPPVRPNLTLVPSPVEGASAMSESVIEEPEFVHDDGVVVQLRRDRGDPEELDELLYGEVIEHAEVPELTRTDQRDLVATERRLRARRRRRDTFGALCALVALTGLLGLAHPLRGAWVASGVFLGLLVVFVGLAVYGQRVEAERRHLEKLQRTEFAREVELESESTIVKYLSSEELTEYHQALTSYYESEDSRLTGEARAIG
jgi:hypothetical protein